MAKRNVENILSELPEVCNVRRRGNSSTERINARRRVENLTVIQIENINCGRRIARANRWNAFLKCALINNPNYVLPEQNYLGTMSKECSFDHCKAVHFAVEKGKILHSCCHSGKIMPSVSVYPPALNALLTGDCSQSKNFRNFIRQYNSANAFASFGAQIANIPGNGPYCLKISGEVYHLTSRSMQVEGETPAYAQLYVYDSDEAVRLRMNHPSNADCYQNIMQTIDSEIRQINPYAHQYKKLKEAVEEEELRIAADGGQVRDIRLLFTRSLADDQRRYNAPTSSKDIAMVYVADRDGNLPMGVDIAVYPKNVQGLQRVATLSKHLDPMVFPLLFPSGECGWTPGFQHHADFSTAQRHTVTAMQFYASKLAVRRNIFNPVHYAGKLFQQYLIHAYIIYESGRLDYIRKNQRHLRVECYQGLQDHVRNLATENGARAGNIVILPSTFTGGPRHMNKLYQDSMAMVRKFGRPDLFITFTCNPKWPEIQNELEHYQSATDRPDIVAKVFQLKVKEFIHDMTEKHVFGKVISWVYTIEQQKRGLPHLHGVFTLCSQDKLHTTSDIDNAVSAELPHPKNSPLYCIILKNNIHGPCGVLNPRSVCMVDGKCSKKFPKSFKDATDNNSAGYPEYRRRDNFSENHVVRDIRIDNRFVVPYNAFLSKKYDAHINVEICSSVASIKYIHKYISKGFDCARIEIRQEDGNLEENAVIKYDEIKQYINCRYVSAPEAVWKIMENPIHDQSHSILLLALHLPDSQSVYFVEGREEEALREASTRNTSLTAWFQLNRHDIEARSILYNDVPNNYVFSADKKWTSRQRGGSKIIGRMPSISPRNIELYHLRLILIKVAGATSFESLRTVDGNLLATFRDAARELKLIDDIGEWKQCMTEASSYLMPKTLRHLFVLILIQCIPSDPLELWNDFNKCMSEDFFHHGVAEETAINLCLLNIQDMLMKENSSCRMQGLPEPDESCSFEQVTDFNVMSENTLGELMAAKLNKEQLQAYNSIMNKFFSDENYDNKCFFIDGPGGTGKTFLYETLIHTLRGKGKKVLSVAWTGIAAILLPGGVTCHTAFNLPLNLQDNTTCKVTSKKRKIIMEADIIIWDEAPMAPGVALEVVERTIRDIMGNDSVFGNKVIVLGGDFRQILPVCRRASRGQLIATCIKSSTLWYHFKTFQLTTNVRALESEKIFSKWLLDLGDGKLPPVEGTSESSVLIPNVNICLNIIQCIYGERHTNADALLMSQRTILCPKNSHVCAINEDVLQRLEGEMKTFHSVDTIINEEGDLDFNEQPNFPVEFLNSINPNGLPPHILNLKIGAIIMLLRNLSVGDGLCNGTRMVVKNFSCNLIQAEIITGNRKGTVHFIPRIFLNTLSDVTIPFNMCRKQFPVKLAYAMTINKSQGQTFERVGLFLPEPVFSHGQLYVACSRVRAQTSLFIQIADGARQGQILTNWYTDNIVYKEIFS